MELTTSFTTSEYFHAVFFTNWFATDEVYIHFGGVCNRSTKTYYIQFIYFILCTVNENDSNSYYEDFITVVIEQQKVNS